MLNYLQISLNYVYITWHVLDGICRIKMSAAVPSHCFIFCLVACWTLCSIRIRTPSALSTTVLTIPSSESGTQQVPYKYFSLLILIKRKFYQTCYSAFYKYWQFILEIFPYQNVELSLSLSLTFITEVFQHAYRNRIYCNELPHTCHPTSAINS